MRRQTAQVLTQVTKAGCCLYRLLLQAEMAAAAAAAVLLLLLLLLVHAAGQERGTLAETVLGAPRSAPLPLRDMYYRNGHHQWGVTLKSLWSPLSGGDPLNCLSVTPKCLLQSNTLGPLHSMINNKTSKQCLLGLIKCYTELEQAGGHCLVSDIAALCKARAFT
jgi:hypothetical protein